jgi:hypothetical protein
LAKNPDVNPQPDLVFGVWIGIRICNANTDAFGGLSRSLDSKSKASIVIADEINLKLHCIVPEQCELQDSPWNSWAREMAGMRKNIMEGDPNVLCTNRVYLLQSNPRFLIGKLSVQKYVFLKKSYVRYLSTQRGYVHIKVF